MRIATKLLKLKPVEERVGGIALTGYRVVEEKWELREVEDLKPGESVINKLLEIAGEYLVRERSADTFNVLEVETLGQRVVIGEGEALKGSTVISPKPQYLRRVLLVKCFEPTNCKVVYEFRPSSQLLVYEGDLLIHGIDYDFIVVECSEYTRLLFPHELALSKAKVKIGERRKTRSRRGSRKRRKSRGR